MKRRRGEVIRPSHPSKFMQQGALGSDRTKPLPKWEIEGKFEDHPDADKDKRPIWRNR